MAYSRSFKIALALSSLIHMGAFVALEQEQVTRRILAPPPTVAVAKQNRPESVRFELIDTPASAAVPTPPEKTNLMSNRNTRAQDRFESEKKLKDSPHMEGKNPDAKDTRPTAIAVPEPPSPPSPPPPPKPANTPPPQEIAKQAQDKEPKEQQPQKPKEAQVFIEPKPVPKTEMIEPEKKEVIQLAKKAASVSPSAAAMPPSSHLSDITVANSRNTDADAEILGELSYAASRHFFGDYLLSMKQAVERQWVSRLISRYTGIVSSKAVIDFKIQPDGRVTDLAVHSSEGDAYFPVVCVSSINDAQPFGSIPYSEAYGLPDEFLNKPLNIRFTFRYN